MNYVQVQTTFDNEDEAKNTAEKIIEAKLAACIQIIPINSIYNWKGSTKKANEFLCLIKTKQSLLLELMEFIKKNHSYETPEIIAIEIIQGLENYLNWISKETK